MDELDTGAETTFEADISTPEPSLLVVRLAGELDLSNILDLEAQVAPALASEPKRMVVDGTDLEFADSSAIALWLRWATMVERFELHNLSPLLRRVLAAMGLEGRLELRP